MTPFLAKYSIETVLLLCHTRFVYGSSVTSTLFIPDIHIHVENDYRVDNPKEG